MCGIVALYNNSSADISAFYNLWMEQETRGRDASGIFALLHDGRVLYAKAPVRASEFVPAIKDYVDRHGLRIVHAIAHARDATRGSPSINRNNHPIVRVQNGTIYAIVHNGTVEISACDSKNTFTDTEEILCAYISKGIDGVYNIARAHYIDSAFAIMAVGESGLIDYVIARFGERPLHYLRSQDTLLFASDSKKLKMKQFKRSITSLVTNRTIDASWKKLVCYACHGKETAQENITGNGYVIRVDSSYYYYYLNRYHYYTKVTCIADNDNALKECRSILSEVYGCSTCYEH